MKKIKIDGHTYVKLQEVKQTLKHALKPNTNDEEFNKNVEDLYQELIKDINEALK